MKGKKIDSSKNKDRFISIHFSVVSRLILVPPLIGKCGGTRRPTVKRMNFDS